MKNTSVLFLSIETGIIVEVARETRSVLQRSLDAAAENSKNTREFANKTFKDDLWAMIGIQEEAFRRLVAFSTAVAEKPYAEAVHDTDPAARHKRRARAGR
jgi:hypothetical protein